MFLTAFIWGLGVACGASFGVLMYVVLFWGLEWLFGKAEQKAAAMKNAEGALMALITRNEISREMSVNIAVIADAARRYEESLEK